MNVKQETTVINGTSYTTTQFPAMQAFEMFGRLVKTIGPAFGVLGTADGQAEIASLAPALAGAFKDLDPTAATQLASDILQMTSATFAGKHLPLTPENINIVFSGRLMDMFRVLVFAIRVNYADFFEGSGLVAPQGPAPAA